jgi:hypothetical protein
MNDQTSRLQLWCQAILPNGTAGHWFSVDASDSLTCHDPTCRFRGQEMHQCPVHRGFLGGLPCSTIECHGSQPSATAPSRASAIRRT